MRTLIFIDDDQTRFTTFRAAALAASDGPFKLEWFRTLSQGIERLRKARVWAVFVSLNLPDSHGLSTLARILETVPGIPTLVMVGSKEELLAKEALRHGAKDYLIRGHFDCYSFDRAIRNMVERKTAEEELFREKERAQVTLNSIGDAVLSTDLPGTVTYLNVVAEEMTGWTSAEAVGRPITEVFNVINAFTREPSLNPMELAIRENKIVGLAAHCILVRRDGSEFAIEDSAAPIHDRSGEIVGSVIVFHDVKASKAMSADMFHRAQHDALTDLPNRSLLEDRLSQAIAAARRNGTNLAVLFLDLDGFKHINDSLGHGVGDKLLQSVGTRLVGAVRTSDTVSRRGGDEFIVLLPEIKLAPDAGILARKLLNALSINDRSNPHGLPVSASIGISTYPEDGDDSETLLKNADTAMYQAKITGANNFQFFRKEMNLQAIERQGVESDLIRALDRREFVLHYQPKVSLKTGKITAAEALIRWIHPERGPLNAVDFIPIAEECGLILRVGNWVLKEACRQAQEWIGMGLNSCRLAVNVSLAEFRSEGFLDGVRSALRESGLDPCFLDLEVTETVALRHSKSTVTILTELKAIGVRLSLDDFGTGRASLGYLKWLPVDSLKIDQSFVHNITTGTYDDTIVSTIIAMAKGANKCVVAEGVETEKQLKFLQAHGCDEAQGYYFCAPMAAAEFAKLLALDVAPFFPHYFLDDPRVSRQTRQRSRRLHARAN
jgi:diguanylate cyclase (GGDEF)-like protein/PAS domain S-box-containing protein